MSANEPCFVCETVAEIRGAKLDVVLITGICTGIHCVVAQADIILCEHHKPLMARCLEKFGIADKEPSLAEQPS